MHTLTTHEFKKHFGGIKAVDGLSVEFLPGKITGVIGPNGSGKSTFVNLLTGMTPLDSGAMYVSGAHVKRIVPNQMPVYGITRTFQEVRLFEQMSVLDNILVVTTCRGAFKSLFEKHGEYHLKIAQKALERVGIWKFKDKSARSLSYGQRKLLEIARVLAMQEIGSAKVVFFDEPFAGLFPEMVKVVVSILKELREQGTTLVLIEHNMDLIRELSDVVYVFESGKHLAFGKAHEVLERPNVVEAYLGE